MLRREPTVLSLTSDDILELQDHLEEYKLQREIKAQHLNLVKSSANIIESAEMKGATNVNGTHNHSLLYSLNKTTPRRNKPSITTDHTFNQSRNRQPAEEPTNPFFNSSNHSEQ
ncbi:unnamed protein product [Kluyveromyces dobzhanskii CBS 2104]|uniref:WGS project CCBQ000000000 data, contig 00058 n=1 Tax=Kluyveromyces dobzhanskii CBS 2104 TaxID=1427455 RepID=A0A0A8LBY2_9SACH|nr:unnamed protein product [Kluyveromyces dobzhanskii CBS 2104]